MKLTQGQVWLQGDQYIRIVHLERLEVEYKSMSDLSTRDGTHHHLTKKEFCRLIKGANLLTKDEVRGLETAWPASTTSKPEQQLDPAKKTSS